MKLRNIAISAMVALSMNGCHRAEPRFHPEFHGTPSELMNYLSIKGQGPPYILGANRDFNGDGVNDAYIRSRYNAKVLYHTRSRDSQPLSENEIVWYLVELKSDKK